MRKIKGGRTVKRKAWKRRCGCPYCVRGWFHAECRRNLSATEQLKQFRCEVPA